MDVSVMVSGRPLEDSRAEYEDVVEASYTTTNGHLAITDWCRREVFLLPPLPAGPGSYRVRYHARDLDDGPDPADASPHAPAACLVQLWPAPPRPAADLKITSETAKFWHPRRGSGFRRPPSVS
jgi:hypothetical protein